MLLSYLVSFLPHFYYEDAAAMMASLLAVSLLVIFCQDTDQHHHCHQTLLLPCVVVSLLVLMNITKEKDIIWTSHNGSRTEDIFAHSAHNTMHRGAKINLMDSASEMTGKQGQASS